MADAPGAVDGRDIERGNGMECIVTPRSFFVR